jgi:hypothetical protein
MGKRMERLGCKDFPELQQTDVIDADCSQNKQHARSDNL